MNYIEDDPKLLQHYLDGGIFRAKYTPRVTHDLSRSNISKIGDIIEVYQNVLIAPSTIPPYFRQHMFSSRAIQGYFPEEDISEIEIIEGEYKDLKEALPVYIYRLYYTSRDQIRKNFGNFQPEKLPFVVERQYPKERDDYVRNYLSDPPATYCEKAVWNGEKTLDIKWKKLYGDKEKVNEILTNN